MANEHNRTASKTGNSIMMIAPTSFFSDYGGHIRILEETIALQALGNKVTIVTYYKGNDVEQIDIRRTRALPWRAEYEVGSSRHKLAFDLFLTIKALLVVRRLSPDIIHGHMHEGALIGGLLARLMRIPLVFDFQGGLSGEMVDHGFLNPEGWIYPWVRRLERFICRLPDVIVTSSTRAKRLLVDEFGVKPAKIFPLPDCVDTRRFDPQGFNSHDKTALRVELGIDGRGPIIIYLGLLADYQGTDHLIEAAGELKKQGVGCHFLIMGYPLVDHYRQLAEKAGVADQVTFTGKIAYRDAPRYLAVGDLAVSAKMSATEGSGKVLNYMAMAIPVIAYDTVVHQEYLADLGLYARAGDAKDLAKVLKEAIERSPAVNQELGHKLRERAVRKFSWLNASERMESIYAHLLDK